VIVLNTAKELVRLESWDDIEGRAGYSNELDPSQHKLSSIIGQYAFQAQIRCGLSNCHTPHNRGYLVLTQSGRETNIGKDCGKRYFGVDFENLAVQFDRDMREKLARENVGNFLLRLDETQRRLKEVLDGEGGGAWVYKTSRPLVEPARGVPSDIVRAIGAMLKTGQSLLMKDRPATERETQIAEAGGNRVKRPHMIAEPVAEIRGLDALREENDLRKLLIVDLDTNLKALDGLNVDTMQPADVAQWSKWVNSVDASFDRAEAAIRAGRELLTAKNLRPFEQILKEPGDVKRFDAFLKGLG
jgi:hypothetical protein